MPQQMDDELLQQAQAGEESAIAALITAMMPAIRKGAAAVAAPGLDFDDAVQEGLIGLFHAVRSYRADKKVPFTAYAAACIANAQQDARRSATRKKHAPLNNSVPLPENSAAPGPEELAIANERCAAVLERINTQLFAPGTRQSACQFGGAHHRPDSPTAALHPQSGEKRPDARPQKAAQ